MTKNLEVVIARDREDLSRRAAMLVAGIITRRAGTAGRVAVALSGGATPRRLYQRLSEATGRHAIPWRKVHLFWGDERCVPADHPTSNYRMAYDALISRISIPPGHVHRMPGTEAKPERAARTYEATLRRFFRPAPGGWPRFDLVLLGIGADGHTASLFPGSPVLREATRWVAAPYVESQRAYRLTLTLPVLNHAALVIFLLAGKEKARVVNGLIAPARPQTPLPCHLVRPRAGKRIVLMDWAAAGGTARSSHGRHAATIGPGRTG